MAKFVAWLFSENNSSLQIDLFDFWHFLYLFIVFGGTALLALSKCHRSEQEKEKALRLFAYLTIGLYIADFFIMPLSDSYNYQISAYKLPFNICTIMAVLVPLVQFNPRVHGFRHVVVTLSITSSMMWMCYPGTALGGQPPFSYVVFQTFMYHGFLFCWGVLNLAYGTVVLDIRNIWHEFCTILAILVWACFGNGVYSGYQNWFFIEDSIFPFLSDEIMPLMVVFSVFGSCLVVYGIYYGIRHCITKKQIQNTIRIA